MIVTFIYRHQRVNGVTDNYETTETQEALFPPLVVFLMIRQTDKWMDRMIDI